MARRATASRTERTRVAAPAIVSPPPAVAGNEVVDFIHRHCFIADGPSARPLMLAPWQQDWIGKVYGDQPSRRAILSTPRKNAKTTLSACLMLNHLVGPSARRNTELYSSALSRDQASLLYSAAAKMVRLNPVLGRLIRIRESAKELVCDELGTRYKALSADASRNLGLNPALTIHDELGSITGPHHELYESLELAAVPNAIL